MRSEKKSTLKCMFDILLLLISNVGIVGALLETLEISWNIAPWNGILWNRIPGNSVLEGGAAEGGLPKSGVVYGAVFWGGLFLFCVAAVLMWNGIGRRRKLRRAGVCVFLYVLAAVLFRKELSAGISFVLQNAVDNLNLRYRFHIVLQSARFLEETEWLRGREVWTATLSMLFVFLPFELSAGFLGQRGRCFYLLAGHAFWLTSACTCDIFPDYFFLMFCVLSVTGVLVQRDFETRPEAGMQAAVLVFALAGLVMGGVIFFLMPPLDRQYEALLDKREELYEVVNGDWIPKLESLLPDSRYGFGPGTDVTGELNRQNIFAYTSSDVYRVTVSAAPQGSLYLKGFVGGTYGETAWEAQADRDLETYYREHGLELPENYCELLNISYEAADVWGQPEESEHILIEELGSKSSYSVYPYGALLTENFQVHADGSVDWKSREYEFQYHSLTGFDGRNGLTGEWAVLEEQYRQYVYDNFLEYPAEDLPLLTEQLEQAGIRTGSIYECVLDIMKFLENQAVYDLDAGKNPSGTDFVEYFLFESHEGYCVHFASAAVLALRYCGIPARYVTGYTASPSAFSADGNGAYTAALTGKQAHAWAEIYLDAIGWVPVEMTPGAVAFPRDSRMDQLVRVGQLAGEDYLTGGNYPSGEDSLAAEDAELPGPDGNMLHSEDIRELEDNPTEEPDQGEETAAPDVPGSMPEYGAVSSGQMLKIGNMIGKMRIDALTGREESIRKYVRIFGIILAAALWLSAMRMMWKARKRRWQGAVLAAGTGECIFLLYRNLRKALHVAGCPMQPAADEEVFWQALQGICPGVTREEYEAFCGILEKNTFGNVEPSAEELRTVRSLHDRLVREVCGRAPFYKRLFLMAMEAS